MTETIDTSQVSNGVSANDKLEVCESSIQKIPGGYRITMGTGFDFLQLRINEILADNKITLYKWEDEKLYVLPNATYEIRKHDYPYFPLTNFEKRIISIIDTDKDTLKEVKFTD